MYKYIDSYERGDTSAVDRQVLGLFDYIEENEDIINKNNVLKYILTNLTPSSPDNSDDETILIRSFSEMVKKRSLENGKVTVIDTLVTSGTLDKIVPYLKEATPILRKKSWTDEDRKKLAPIFAIYECEGVAIPKKGKGKKPKGDAKHD